MKSFVALFLSLWSAAAAATNVSQVSLRYEAKYSASDYSLQFIALLPQEQWEMHFDRGILKLRGKISIDIGGIPEPVRSETRAALESILRGQTEIMGLRTDLSEAEIEIREVLPLRHDSFSEGEVSHLHYRYRPQPSFGVQLTHLLGQIPTRQIRFDDKAMAWIVTGNLNIDINGIPVHERLAMGQQIDLVFAGKILVSGAQVDSTKAKIRFEGVDDSAYYDEMRGVDPDEARERRLEQQRLRSCEDGLRD